MYPVQILPTLIGCLVFEGIKIFVMVRLEMKRMINGRYEALSMIMMVKTNRHNQCDQSYGIGCNNDMVPNMDPVESP